MGKIKAKNSLPEHKFTRGMIAGVGAAKTGVKHLSYISRVALSAPDRREALRVSHEMEIGRLIFCVLSQLRGTALKISQILSTEAEFLPEGIRSELAKACYEVPALNRAHIRKVFVQEFGYSASRVFHTFEADAFAAASIGQVHKASVVINDASVPVAVKVQYPGVAAAITSDIALLRGLLKTLATTTSYVPKKEVLDHLLKEIETRLYEEVDYNLEAEQTEWFRHKLSTEKYCIPQIYSEYSGQRVLTTEFIQGKHLKEWLAANPSQSDRNRFGQLLFDYFHETCFVHGKINADFHAGNFLFMDDGRLGILDFGFVRSFDQEYRGLLKQLFHSFKEYHLNKNAQVLLDGLKKINMLAVDLDVATFNQYLEPMMAEVCEWFIEPYIQASFDFTNMVSHPSHTLNEGKKYSRFMKAFREEQLSYDRGYMGLTNILKEMKAVVNTQYSFLE